MPVDKEYIIHLVLEEVMGSLTNKDAVILQELLENDPEAVLLREEILRNFNSPETKRHLENTDNLTLEGFWDTVKERQLKRHLLIKRSRTVFLLLTSVIAVYFLVKCLSENTAPVPAAFSSAENFSFLQTEQEQIILNNQQQVSISGVTFRKDSNKLIYLSGQSNRPVTLNVCSKDKYKIQLSDNSRLMLDGGTTLKFPASFGDGPRDLTIYGTAYIKSTGDANHPLKVHLPGQNDITVLGTEFNVKSSDSTNVQIALINGKIKVSNKQQDKILIPGQIINCNNFQVIPFNPDITLAWKKEKYSNTHTSMDELRDALMQLFDIEVINDSPPQSNQRNLNVTFYSNEELNVILSTIKKVQPFDYRYDEKNILHIK